MVQVSSNATSSKKNERIMDYSCIYMYVGQMHVHGLYMQFASKHYTCILMLEETNSHGKCVASPRLTTPSQHGVTGSGQLHGNLSVLTCYIGHEMRMALLY